MEKTYTKKLKLIHIGSDPEFLSPVSFKNYLVEIDTMDNPFSVSQWILTNGFPDGLICERKLPGSKGFEFYDFWITQFDPEKKVPFFLLDDEKTQETLATSQIKSIDAVFIKPVNAEEIISRFLELIDDKPSSINTLTTEPRAFKPYKLPFLKRLFDLVFATVGLIIALPFLLVFMIAIRLGSKGSVFYVSKRVGSGFRVFDFFKLRSMYIASDKRLKRLADLNEYNNNFTVKGDPRITKIGKIIRKLKIDELPQYYNVIKGDISIVGNRPLPLYEAELLTTTDWNDRFDSPAGITGPWRAVTRRKLKSMSHEERNSLQNKYLTTVNHKYSFLKDMWIIFRTVI